MKVVIKEREYDYKSDYPNGWLFSSGDYFKFPVMVGHHTCFIKRFEKKRPGTISGWDLLNKLKHTYRSNLPRIFDIKSAEENGKNIHYVFYECLKGSTLDALISQDAPVDLAKLTNDLFNALAAVHEHNYWFADFCEKNIFCEENGRFLLIDLDSAQPASKAPDNGMFGNKDYWALVFAFYRDILEYKDVRLSDLSGISLNMLQIIFLILRIKMAYSDNAYDYNSTELYNQLPSYLNRIDPVFRLIFNKVFQQGEEPLHMDNAIEIRDLIHQKIIQPELMINDPLPEIESFNTSAQLVNKDDHYILNWQVKNATSVELYKNGMLHSKYGRGKNSLRVKAVYDGGSKKITYLLIASNGINKVKSQPQEVEIDLSATVKEETADSAKMADEVVTIDSKTGTTAEIPERVTETIGIEQELQREENNKIRLKFIAMAAAGLFAVAALVFFIFRPSPPKAPVITDFGPKYILGPHVITIYGQNFPHSNNIQVLFNNVPGILRLYSPDSLLVSFPELANVLQGSISIAVVFDKDTLKASDHLIAEAVMPPSSQNTVVVTPPKKDTVLKAVSETKILPKVIQQKASKDTVKAVSNPVVEQPPVVKNDDPPKALNINELVTVKKGEYKRKLLGGIHDLQVTVQNGSPFVMDKVMVEVSYLKNDKEVKKEMMTFEHVDAHNSLTMFAPNTNRGKDVDVKIVSISSAELNASSHGKQEKY